MKEDIKKILIENAGTVLADMILINTEKASEKIELHIMEFLTWEKENSYRFEYYTREQVYNIWKNRK